MSILTDLPFDVLFNTLVLLDDIQDLYLGISTCKVLYQVFQDRRSLVLQKVFSNQLIQEHEKGYVPEPGRERQGAWTHWLHHRPFHVLQSAERIIKRCGRSPEDALSLHKACWDTFLSFDNRYWINCLFGTRLIDRFISMEQNDQALAYAVDLWNRLMQHSYHTETGVKRSRRFGDRRVTGHARLAQQLAKLYSKINRQADGAAVLRQCIQWYPYLQDEEIVSALIACYVGNNELSVKELVPFLQDRAATDKVHHGRRGSTYSSPDSGLHYWTLHLVQLQMRLGMHSDALCTLRNAWNTSATSQCDENTLVALSRRTIQLCKAQNFQDDLLEVRKEMLAVLDRAAERWTSQYIVWGQDYARDLRAFNMYDEALAVEEKLWQRTKNVASRAKNRSMVYHTRNAGWTLYKTHLKRGDVAKAMIVRDTYDLLLSESVLGGVDRLAWPGAVLRRDEAQDGVYKTQVGREDVHVPIMV